MNFLKNKKAIVTHPVMLFVIGVVLGLIVAYLWAAYTTIPHPFCPT